MATSQLQKMSRQQRPLGQYRCAVTKLPSVWELGPDVTGALAVATTANVAAMMNFLMSASVAHHERNWPLEQHSVVLKRVL